MTVNQENILKLEVALIHENATPIIRQICLDFLFKVSFLCL